MGQIPADATHWDSGDWIEWHRTAIGKSPAPSIATPSDPMAALTALNVNMLNSARAWWEATGEHLLVYDAIARVHAALEYDLPVSGEDPDPERMIRICVLPPHGPGNTVDVDLGQPFSAVLLVRIRDNWTVESRMVSRARLNCAEEGTLKLSWAALPAPR